MRGLYISFVIKRRKKLDKIMDFFLVIALFIFVFTFLFYVQYVQKENKYNSTNKTLQTNIVEMNALKKQLDEREQQNASAIERNYDAAYKELKVYSDLNLDYKEYINDIYKKRDELSNTGIIISSLVVDTKKGTITLGLSFSDKEPQIDYRYRAALLDLKWVPNNGVVYHDTNSSTTWEVYVNGTTTKE